MNSSFTIEGQPFEVYSEFEPENFESGTGRWVRQGRVIILDDSARSATPVDSELSSRFSRSVPFLPAKTTGAAGGSPLPVSLFPPRPADPLTTDPKMETALRNAIARLERDRRLAPGTFPVRFTFVDITNASVALPSAGYLETVTDYIASEAKVAVMYAAYALRDMVQRFAAAIGANTANWFTQLASQMNSSIVKASTNIERSLLMDEHRVPSYRNVFAAKPATQGMRVAVTFTPGFDRAIEGMIVPSNNAAAATCVHGVGYGYLNGALAAGGFFDPATGQGLWVAGDFLGGRNGLTFGSHPAMTAWLHRLAQQEIWLNSSL